ncbi:uncharacterized protein VICG_00545 [Vittaforma corneae ATCC 50505]|uniref:Uncharacterized protein n=1 Tax=Vittaforma corneae (strain ATCC 50505) TaxID=993615 RepID=L2GNM7_VITCO|nr:uncharacterized protein VICG_00545 [Vittaforma corneae ATCC 50505]ELA42446.1 hypothetical protein VICG_00545 [Vittaforma corneae ATCC 50505]
MNGKGLNTFNIFILLHLFFVNKNNGHPMKIRTILIRNILYLVVIGVISIIYEKVRKTLLISLVSSIEYIVYRPVGIKHNRILKIVLGKAYKSILDPSCCFDVLTSLRICSKIAFGAYSQVFKVIREIFELLNNRTYNPYMKRYDTIYLQVDQIVLSVILMTILLIIFANLILFYCFFVVIYLVTEATLIGWELFEDLIEENSVEMAFKRLRNKYLLKKSYFGKRILTGELPLN